LAALRPKADLDREYLLFALKLLEPELAKEGSGSTFSAISRVHLENLRIPLAPLAEQRRIAAILTKQMAVVDKARAAAQAKLDALKAMPATFLRQTFGSSEAREWPVFSLGDLADVSGGIQKTPARSPTTFFRRYLTVRNVQQGYLDLSHVETFEVSPVEFERLRLRRGDVLIVEGNGSLDQIGRNALFDLEDEDWIHQNHIIRVRFPTGRFDSRFVSLFLNSPQGRMQMVEKARSTSGLYTLSGGKVRAIEVPMPSVQQQRLTAERLTGQLRVADAARRSAESELAAINALPAALLRRAFSGELSAKPTPRTSRSESPFHLRAACTALYAHRWATQRKRTGKTKLAKAQALSQTHVGLSLPSSLRRYPHGPYDPEFDAVIAYGLEQGWLHACEVPGFSDPVYEAGPRIGEALTHVDSTVASLRPELDRLATLMLDWDRDRAERVATLFTAWNDLLIEDKAADEDAVVEEVLQRWHPEKALKFTAQALRAELAWMRTQGLVPRGHEPRTEGGQGSLDFARRR
jgi:type I restriction enzyme S subunit